MILKIGSGVRVHDKVVEQSWTFIGDVAEATIIDKCVDDKRTYWVQICKRSPSGIGRDEVDPRRYEQGQSLGVLDACYLMSDDGKTIEKLK